MMNQPPFNPLPFPIVKASLMLMVVVLVVAGGVYGLLTGVWGWTSQARPCLIGAGVSIIIGLSGFVPVWLMSRKNAYGTAYGFMVSIPVRCVVGFAAVAWLRWGASVADAQTLLMWIAGWYMLVLAVEVKLISSHVLATTNASRMMLETN